MISTWDHTVTLLSIGDSYDDIGNPIEGVTSKLTIFAKRKPTNRREFYLAGQNGISIDETFVIHPYEYSKQTHLEFEGLYYTIVRTYQISNEELELQCSVKVGDLNGQ